MGMRLVMMTTTATMFTMVVMVVMATAMVVIVMVFVCMTHDEIRLKVCKIRLAAQAAP